MKIQTCLTVLGALLLWSVVATASALTVDGSGNITDWGFTPFGTQYGDWTDGAPPTATGEDKQSDGTFGSTGVWTEGNNTAPIDYPIGSVDFVPSPGGANGEKFDLEFLAWRTQAGDRIQVLGITSVNPNLGATFGGTTFHLGDVFVDVNDDGTYDRVLTAGQYNTPLNDPLHVDDNPLLPGNQTGYSHQMASGIYSIEEFHGITNQGGGYGNNPAIAGATNPFSLMSGVDQGGNMVFASQSFNYGTMNGSNENATWILEWTFDIAALGPLPADYPLNSLRMHWTTECGNDVIETDPLPIPEPATLALMGLGLVSAGLMRRRIRVR